MPFKFSFGLLAGTFVAVTACSVPIQQPNSVSKSSDPANPSKVAQVIRPANPLETGGQANPLEKEGQIVLTLQIEAAKVKGLEKAPRDAEGMLNANGADFRIAQEGGSELAKGKVENNAIILPPEKLGKGPYVVTITLAGGELLTSHIQDTLNKNDRRTLNAENVTVTQTQNCGDKCNQVIGGVTINQNDVKTQGPNCPGVGNQCASSTHG